MTTYRTASNVPGEYVPGTGFVYRLDPRTKLFVVLLYVWTVLTADASVVLAGCAVLAVAAVPFCRVGVRDVLRTVRSMMWLTVVLVIMLLAVHRVRQTPFAAAELLPFARILLAAVASLLFTRTTVPADLVESLVPGHAERVPRQVKKLAFVMLVVLQFTPFLFRELFRLRMLHSLRGPVRPTLRQRFTGLVTVVIPLFEYALRKADLLADALVVRGFGFDTGRTALFRAGFGMRDAVAACVASALFAGALLV